jgi:hypothetical protein
MASEPSALELKMDPATLYREDSFTDRRMGLIRVLTPVTSAGLTDPTRKVLYVGEAQLLTAAGPLPLSFEIEASSLGEAAERFGAGAKAAVERAMHELQEMRREAASSIVIPGREQLGFGRQGGPGAGGGKIQFP